MKTSDFIGCRKNPSFRTDFTIDVMESELPMYQEWSNYVLPPTSQYKLGLCVCIASCCALEMKIRRDMGAGHVKYPMQLDPRVLYKYAREKHWPNEPWQQGGLLLYQGYDAMIDLGWIPKEAEIIHARSKAIANKYMYDFPGIMGLGITDGWLGDRVSRRTGQIDESMSPAGSFSGHALTMVSFLSMADKEFLLFANSGWKENWGKNGYGVATLSYIEQAMLDDFLFLKMPLGWKIHVTTALEMIPSMLTDDWGNDNVWL